MSVAHGIHTVDTAFQRDHFDAAYLIVQDGHGAFVDCGTTHSLPNLLACVAQAGLQPAGIDWLILTHVHLDHAGGAGALMQQLPNARLVVHPRGAQHMIDPARLIAGATAVYGEAEIARSYGQIVPVPAERVVVAEDGHQVLLAGRALVCVDTPGHARHHLCVWDTASQSWFTGDTFGLSYRELDHAGGVFIIPTSSPVQFDPEAMHASIERLMREAPEAMYLTHYGRVEGTARLAKELHEQIDAMVAIALRCNGEPERHRLLVDALGALYVARLRLQGSPLDAAEVLRVLAMDIELNAQGLACWLDREKR